MKPFILICIAFLVVFTNPLYGQYQLDIPGKPNRISHDIGVSAGFTTGIGLAYRLWYARFGGQVTFLPFNNGKTEFYSGALSVMYAFHATDKHRFFMYQGNHLISNNRFGEEVVMSLGAPYIQVQSTSKYRYMNNGIGLGYEFFENEDQPSRFGFSVQAGLAAYETFTRSHFTAETSFMYRFH